MQSRLLYEGAEAVSEFLKRPRSGEPAEQCREMGISVGDTIEGRESCGRKYWHEARLTLVWAGRKEAVFVATVRSKESPCWSAPEETAGWTLDCRRWKRVAPSPSSTKGTTP